MAKVNSKTGQPYTVQQRPDGSRVHIYADGRKVVVKAQNNQDPRQNTARTVAAQAAYEAQSAAPAAPQPAPLPSAEQVRAGGGWKDSGWTSAVANIQAGKSHSLNKITSQRGDTQADFERNKTLTEEGRGKTLGGTRNAANGQGLLYSGILSEREGDVNTDFNRRQETLLDAVTRANRGFDEQEQDVNLAAASAERQAEEDAIARYLDGLLRRQPA